MKRIILILLSLLLFQNILFAQNTINWEETQGTILKIEKYRTKRYVNEKATVEYTVQGDTTIYQSTLMLDRVPIIGSLKSVGDVIEFSYDPAQPRMLKSDTNVFINSYGLYILMLAGLIILIITRRKSLARIANQKSNTKNI